MPLHNSSTQTKKVAVAGGTATRSAVTGKQLSRAAIRALNKNAEAAEEYLSILESATRFADLEELKKHSLCLARVDRSLGAGHMECSVMMEPAATAKAAKLEELVLSIAGNIRFKGRAGTKTDRANCILVGDMAVVRGGVIAGKISRTSAKRCSEMLAKLGVVCPKGFFAFGEEATFEDDGFEFDREDEADAEAAEKEARIAAEEAAARARALARKLYGKTATKLTVESAATVITVGPMEDVSAEVVRMSAEDEEADADEVAPAAAGGGGGSPSTPPSGMNRRQRREAEQALKKAQEEAELLAAVAAAKAKEFERTRRMAEGTDTAAMKAAFAAAAAMKSRKVAASWEDEDDEGELDIDAL